MKLWIARDGDGELHMFLHEPITSNKPGYQVWEDPTDNYSYGEYLIDCQLFPEITFENSPKEVELKLVENYG